MIRAAYFDVDGTLVSFERHAIPDSALETIEKMRSAGIRIFLSTGRNGDSTRFLMDSGLFDGEILLSGQLCRIGGETVFANPVCREDIEAAVSAAETGNFTLGFLSGNESFVTGVNTYVLDACAYAGMAVPRVEPAALARRHPIYQIHCYGLPGVEDGLLERTSRLTAVRWSRNFADVFPVGGGKDRGMQAMNAHLGIDPGETIAFGDGENDISMLRYAGVGVAMGNAGENVKRHADHVTDSVDNDGIRKAVQHFSHLIFKE